MINLRGGCVKSWSRLKTVLLGPISQGVTANTKENSYTKCRELLKWIWNGEEAQQITAAEERVSGQKQSHSECCCSVSPSPSPIQGKALSSVFWMLRESFWFCFLKKVQMELSWVSRWGCSRKLPPQREAAGSSMCWWRSSSKVSRSKETEECDHTMKFSLQTALLWKKLQLGIVSFYIQSLGSGTTNDLNVNPLWKS